MGEYEDLWIPKQWDGQVKRSGNSLMIAIPDYIVKENKDKIIRPDVEYKADVSFRFPIIEKSEIEEIWGKGFSELYELKYKEEFERRGYSYNDLVLCLAFNYAAKQNKISLIDLLKKEDLSKKETRKFLWINKKMD